MSATAMQVSQSVAVTEKEWVKLFPKQVTENYTSSVTFIKQLTLVAVSAITYLKNAFPEGSYSSETFAGVRLKILNDNKCSDDLAQFVSTALQQAFEAFDKRYIHQLALCFYENECQPENLIEYHIFEYTYSPEGVTLNINSKNRNSDKRSMKCSFESVKARTTMFIRSLSLYLMQQSQMELPVNYDISLRLYYNEDAPEGYQAPGFSSTESPDHLAPTLSDAVRLGWVDTPYHSLVARSYTRDLLPASDEAVPSLNVPVMTQPEEDFQAKSKDVPPDMTSRVAAAAAPALRCACKQPGARDHALLTCRYCHTQQHAVCFGYLTSAPSEHCCAACFDADPTRTPSDAKLVELDNKRRECLCVFRRTLALCARARAVEGRALVARLGLGAASAARMLRLLQSHCIVPPTGEEDLDTQRKINHMRLKLAFKRFFRPEDIEEDSMVDRLMAETAAAQDNMDPLGDVLSPLEKITLHNTSNLGQIIENPLTERTNIDDKTLQQYREALTTDDITEELPLSGSHNPVKNVEKIGKKKTIKRKSENDDLKPKLRSGAKTKKARAMS